MGKEKEFEILNYDELPRRNPKGSCKYSNVIGWDLIEKGFIIRTRHQKYGYNEFEFAEYIDKFKFKALYKGNDIVINIYGLLGGKISSYLIEYKSYNNKGFIIHNIIKQDGWMVYWGSIEKGTVLKTTHEKYGDNELTFVGYKDKTIYLKFEGVDRSLDISLFAKGAIGRVIGERTDEFKIPIGFEFKTDNADLIITEREARKSEYHKSANLKWYKYTCNICGWTEGWMVEGHLTEGRGCSCCAGRTVVPHINSIKAKAPWMIDLGVSEEDAVKHTPNAHNKVSVACPNCGNRRDIILGNVYSNKSIGCTCRDGFSYPEKFTANMLMQLGVKFETQYSPDYLIREEDGKKSKKYSDFYLPKYNLIIETDGRIGHKGGVLHSKSKKTLDEQIEIDNWKDEQHKLHGVDTIRINCFQSDVDYIKNNVLNSKLSDILDLNTINWITCDEYAMKSNKIKEVCDCWNSRELGETTSDIGRKLNIVWASTIIGYLKKGS